MSTPAQTVFVFAHPDDEFAISIAIERASKRGEHVSAIYLTDGAVGDTTAAQRAHESTRVLNRLGVSTRDVHFVGQELGVPDGQLHLHLDRVLNELRTRFSEDAVVCCYAPAWEGGHPDHDAAHIVALIWCGENATQQYSLYHGAKTAGPLFQVMKPIVENGESIELANVTLAERRLAASLIVSYPSQARSFAALGPQIFARLLSRQPFAVQRCSFARILGKPHTGRLLYERHQRLAYADFRAAVDTFLQKHIQRLPSATS